MIWICVSGAALAVIVLLAGKLHLMRKSAREIREAFQERLTIETNTLIDISSRDREMRRLAEAVNIQLRLLRSERRRFQQGDLELKEAVTNISHDLRTPLTAVCGYLDLLKREQLSPEVRRYLKMIENRTGAMTLLTEELFRYSIASSTAEELTLEDISLNIALEDSLSAVYAVMTARGIVPQVRMPERPVIRRLDRQALSRILGNVLSNAVKYSDGTLSVALYENGEMVCSNPASSLTKVTAARLFDRFYTVETGRSSTGLGLSIAKLLTEQMGGTIAADYDDGVLSIRIRF